MMSTENKNRQLAKLARIRDQADIRFGDVYGFAETLIHMVDEIGKQRDELRTATEPVRTRQAREITRLQKALTVANIRADRLAREVKDAAEEFPDAQHYQDQRDRIQALEGEIDRLDARVTYLTEGESTKTIALESMSSSDFAYRTRGKNGIDTIDRLRGQPWANAQRGRDGVVHSIGQSIRAGDEVELVIFQDRGWSWVVVGT